MVTESVADALAPGANEPNVHVSVWPVTTTRASKDVICAGNAQAPWLAVITPTVKVVGSLTYMRTLSARSGPRLVVVAVTVTAEPGANAGGAALIAADRSATMAGRFTTTATRLR